MKTIWTICFIITLIFPAPVAGFAAEVPQDGYDWQSIAKSERVAYCSLLIYGMVGLGNYPSNEINSAANFFAGRINFYYKTHSLNNPIEKAAAWAWPEARKFLAGL